jgi:hypothetical protein
VSSMPVMSNSGVLWALVAAFVADGNLAAAHRQVANLSTLLDRELAVTLSRAFLAEFHRLVSPR